MTLATASARPHTRNTRRLGARCMKAIILPAPRLAAHRPAAQQQALGPAACC
jgi:hypothetical protein